MLFTVNEKLEKNVCYKFIIPKCIWILRNIPMIHLICIMLPLPWWFWMPSALFKYILLKPFWFSKPMFCVLWSTQEESNVDVNVNGRIDWNNLLVRSSLTEIPFNEILLEISRKNCWVPSYTLNSAQQIWYSLLGSLLLNL